MCQDADAKLVANMNEQGPYYQEQERSVGNAEKIVHLFILPMPFSVYGYTTVTSGKSKRSHEVYLLINAKCTDTIDKTQALCYNKPIS